MKIKQRKKSHAPLIIAIVVIFVLAGGATFWYFHENNNAFLNNKSNQQTDTNKTDDSNSNDTDTTTDNTTDSSSNEDKPTDSIVEPDKNVQTDKPPTSSTLNVWVTSQSISNNTLHLRVQIGQNISSGTCTLVIGNYSTSVPVAFEPQSASCQGFDIPTNAYSGDNFTISVKSGNKSGSVKGSLGAN